MLKWSGHSRRNRGEWRRQSDSQPNNLRQCWNHIFHWRDQLLQVRPNPRPGPQFRQNHHLPSCNQADERRRKVFQCNLLRIYQAVRRLRAYERNLQPNVGEVTKVALATGFEVDNGVPNLPADSTTVVIGVCFGLLPRSPSQHFLIWPSFLVSYPNTHLTLPPVSYIRFIPLQCICLC